MKNLYEHVDYDISLFGRRELEKGVKILSVYKTIKDYSHLGKEVKLCYNNHLDLVYITDIDGKCAVLDEDNNLVDYNRCNSCNFDGTPTDLREHKARIKHE